MSKSSSSGYGTLPTSTITNDLPPLSSSPNTFIARARFHTENFIARRRPWREFLDYTKVTRPSSYEDFVRRIKRNLNYFRVNYAMVILLILFLSLIYQPISMITFLIVFVGWFFLYFFRDPRNPVVIMNHVFDDRVVLMALSLLTIFAGTDDLFLDENENGDGGLVSVVGGN
ncbi:prenylated rab acceptor PRA1 [Artemisia annua]|uniref:PRA1 family protein n=1 Tax=Artemisia annua TaxID=35608 RepID=A0A2U1KY91_ARTAN|nr:prenylated rab acceptor PRA1 [Artemisia annua]